MCQVSFLSSWEKEMNQKSRFHPADCDLRSALQPPLRAARVWRQGVGVEGKGKGGSCVMFSHQNCLRAGRVAGQGVCRVGGRKEERRSGGSWGDGRVPCQVALGRKKRRLRQSASAFPPANIAPICTLHTTTQSPKGEHLILLIWPRLHQFCKRERESGFWIWKKHVLGS